MQTRRFCRQTDVYKNIQHAATPVVNKEGYNDILQRDYWWLVEYYLKQCVGDTWLTFSRISVSVFAI